MLQDRLRYLSSQEFRCVFSIPLHLAHPPPCTIRWTLYHPLISPIQPLIADTLHCKFRCCPAIYAWLWRGLPPGMQTPLSFPLRNLLQFLLHYRRLTDNIQEVESVGAFSILEAAAASCIPARPLPMRGARFFDRKGGKIVVQTQTMQLQCGVRNPPPPPPPYRLHRTARITNRGMGLTDTWVCCQQHGKIRMSGYVRIARRLGGRGGRGCRAQNSADHPRCLARWRCWGFPPFSASGASVWNVRRP